MINQLIIF